MEKTYFEIKITFVHIVIFLIAIIAIGMILFYMGFQAGQRRVDTRTAITAEQNPANPSNTAAEELKIIDEKPIKTVGGQTNGKQSIPEEMKLHQTQTEKKPQSSSQEKIVAENYAIQVGAFADFANAQKCSKKFTSLGYQTEIIVETVNQKKWHTVRVGSFASMAEAQREKEKLERLENKKFAIKKAR